MPKLEKLHDHLEHICIIQVALIQSLKKKTNDNWGVYSQVTGKTLEAYGGTEDIWKNLRMHPDNKDRPSSAV